MTDREHLTKIFKAITNGRLALSEGGISKNWYNYFLNIEELMWGRNLVDGWKIDVYKEQYGEHIGTINLAVLGFKTIVEYFPNDEDYNFIPRKTIL